MRVDFTTSFLPFLKKEKIKRNALGLLCTIYARNHSLEHMMIKMSLVNMFNSGLAHK